MCCRNIDLSVCHIQEINKLVLYQKEVPQAHQGMVLSPQLKHGQFILPFDQEWDRLGEQVLKQQRFLFPPSSLDNDILWAVLSIIHGVSVHIFSPPYTPQRFVETGSRIVSS